VILIIVLVLAAAFCSSMAKDDGYKVRNYIEHSGIREALDQYVLNRSLCAACLGAAAMALYYRYG
jgi:hypothetical protein